MYLSMKYILVIFTILISAYARRKPTCHACIHSVCYSRELIIRGFKLSGQLAIDRTSNILYFHYRHKRKEVTGAFSLDEVKLSILPLNFTFGRAVDQLTRNLYTSGVQGVYIYNPFNNSTELYALKDKTIWNMQYEDKLYYTEFKSKGLYKYENKKSIKIPELSDYQIDNFIIDRQKDIYFMSNYTIHVLRNGSKQVELFEDEIYYMSTDRNGIAYFIQPYTRGMYKINHMGKLSEVGAFKKDSVFLFVFDNENNIIYEGNDSSVYYLAPKLTKCSVTTKGVGRFRKKIISTTDRRIREKCCQ
ncbi:ommochrome-binding protein-like isoform X2 [Danaus plexippus]|uniref:ommochrome-binding protein-like isoform X2 n=1 Tax=Danaus plexippus TaxID=13037 RepID=UPI002AB2F45B|nr:ommochrome-binding protein-like isoform X2 [Danaus plexippus]